MTTTTIPGAGMTYTELCDSPRDSEVRRMWRALGELASVLGVPMHASGYGMRTKTVDEYVAAITEVLPEHYDIVAAALATAALSPDVPQWTERYEIRRLMPNGAKPGTMHYIVEDTADDYDTAQTIKTHYEAHLKDAVMAIVRVETTTKVDTYPKDYVPRR